MDAAAQPILRGLIPWATTELAATPVSDLFSLEIARPTPKITDDLEGQADGSTDHAAQVAVPSFLVVKLFQPEIPIFGQSLLAAPAAEKVAPDSSEGVVTQEPARPRAVAATIPAERLDQVARPHPAYAEKVATPPVSQPEARVAAKHIISAETSDDFAAGAQRDSGPQFIEPANERTADAGLALPPPKPAAEAMPEPRPDESSDDPALPRPSRDAAEQTPTAAVKPADATATTSAPPKAAPSESNPPISPAATEAPRHSPVPIPRPSPQPAAPVQTAPQDQVEPLRAPSLEDVTPLPEPTGRIVRSEQATEPVHVGPDHASKPPIAPVNYAVSVQTVPGTEATSNKPSPDTLERPAATPSMQPAAESKAAPKPSMLIPHVEIPLEPAQVAMPESTESSTNNIAEPVADPEFAPSAENNSENSEKIEQNTEASTDRTVELTAPADHALEPVAGHDTLLRHGHVQATHAPNAPVDRPGADPRLGQQLVANLPQAADRPVEITLAPEELGRVRLTLSLAEGGPHLVVQADRPETLELMRRHVDQLAQDFRDMGFEGMGFAFSQHPARSQGDAKADFDGQSAVSDAPLDIASPLTVAPDRIPGRGLDLRL